MPQKAELYTLRLRLDNLHRDIRTELRAEVDEHGNYRYQVRFTKRANFDIADRFYNIREDVKKAMSDPDFDRLVPPIWYLPPAKAGIVTILALIFLIFVIPSLIGFLINDSTKILFPYFFIISTSILFIFLFGLAFSEGKYKRLFASNIQTVLNRTNLLFDYLNEQSVPNTIEDLQRNYNFLSSELDNCWDSKESLRINLEQVKVEANELREKLIGKESPLGFVLDKQTSDKLNSLERIRLTEAIMAYNIHAWTPTAAVCGMILEGRLQQLCQENGLPGGGFNKMITQLNEAGLLKEHHQTLVRVGEFFRHRSSHPTTEEFNREKATLVITTLIILLQEVF